MKDFFTYRESLTEAKGDLTPAEEKTVQEYFDSSAGIWYYYSDEPSLTVQEFFKDRDYQKALKKLAKNSIPPKILSLMKLKDFDGTNDYPPEIEDNGYEEEWDEIAFDIFDEMLGRPRKTIEGGGLSYQEFAGGISAITHDDGEGEHTNYNKKKLKLPAARIKSALIYAGENELWV